MKPFYQKDNITVYNQGFESVLPFPNNSFFVFDPPYNIGFNYDIYKDNISDEEYVEMICMFQHSKVAIIQYPEAMQRLIVPALGPPDHTSVWCYNSQYNHRFRLINWYGVKPDYSRIKQPYKNPRDKRVAKKIVNGKKGSDLYEWWDDIQIVKNVSKEKGLHPCPVPETLMKRIILLGADPNDIIVDPFAGGLTTLKAAKDLGYPAIGTELSKDYILDGLLRLAQPLLF